MSTKNNTSSTSLGSILNTILIRYANECKREFVNNELAKQIRHEFPKSVCGILNNRYKVSGSAGMSKWARVPWIGIFDEEISTGAQAGYDVVYLFTEDMKGVYLSVNQGYTYFSNLYKNPSNTICRVTDYWKHQLDNLPHRFSFDTIYLCSYHNKTTSTGLPKGYAEGNICSVYYAIENLPEETVLIDDLYKALSILSEIKSKLIGLDYKHTNNFILSQTENTKQLKPSKDEKQFENELNFQRYKFQSTVPPKASIFNKHSGEKAQKVDYVKRNITNKKLGFAGECAVLKYEKNKLLKSPKADIRKLASSVKHCSVEIGDGLGYDIQSYDYDGNKIYIEVKTTFKGIDTPFYISENELVASRNLNEFYYLYRLYDIDTKSGNIKFYILNGALDKLVDLQCVNYLALPK